MGSVMNNVARTAHYVTGFIFSNDLWFYRILYSDIGTCIIQLKANIVFPRYFKIIYNWLSFRKYCFCSPWGLTSGATEVQKACLNFFCIYIKQLHCVDSFSINLNHLTHLYLMNNTHFSLRQQFLAKNKVQNFI